MRVPFESFAGEPDFLGFRRYMAPLELVVRAAERTNDYLVFEAPLIEILIDWKWTRFVRPSFFCELLVYCVHLVFVIAWNVGASETAHLPLQAILGTGTAAQGWDQPEVWLLFLWSWTTFMCFFFAYL